VNYSPSYLIKNRYGIFYFQYRIPTRLLAYSKGQKLIRLSLRTRILKDALKQARMLRTIMDKLANQFFTSTESFGKGMELLMKYNAMQPCDWNTMETFLFELEEDEDDYLSRALNYRAAQSLETQELKQEVKFLRQTIECLNDKKYNNNQYVVENSVPKEISPLLSDLIEQYKANCKNRWATRHYSSNERDLFPKLDLFLEAIGDKPMNEVRKEDISRYSNLIYKYPANKNKKPAYKNLSIEEILITTIPDEDKLSNETIGNYFTKIKSFLTWCEDNSSFTAPDLKKPISTSPKNPTPEDEQRDAFSDEDLKRLFESKHYLQGIHSKPSHFWIPLLALFTGARENELCQLYKLDVYKDTESSIWVIDINQNKPDKKLKRTHHKRIVPIHNQLIKLGFIDFRESVKTERLFDDLPFRRGGYGDNFSKWFNDTYRNKNNCNVGQSPDEKKDFHSFRHTVISQWSNIHKITSPTITKLVGQKSEDKSEAAIRYTKKQSILENHKIINKLKFNVDFNKIRKQKYKPLPSFTE
jgi:integrase